ncbi:MAG: carboxypeptidase-like regulatory domain-containing protein [Geobacteraceae bacterium]|nr:carboxypeptidase-like regulatory domain-containing protein [Geobacteraceae bacterium]
MLSHKIKLASYAIAALFLLLPVRSCFNGISGRVVDNATGKPIEGALVSVQWTRSAIFSLEGSSCLVLNTETKTNKNGKFTIWHTPFNPFVDSPVMVIYKEGYLPFNNNLGVFPGRENYMESAWKSNQTYKLPPYNYEYPLHDVEFFITGGFIGLDGFPPRLARKIDTLNEIQRARDNTLTQIDFKGSVVDKKSGKPIEGALVVAMNQGTNSIKGVTQVAESISDRNGNVRITGNFTVLERSMPKIIVYKKGYMAISNGPFERNFGNELNGFKWENGYKFEISPWQTQLRHWEHYWYIYLKFAKQAAEEGSPTLLNSILWEKDL